VAEDLRFTRSKDGKTLYAIAMAWPKGALTVKSAHVTKAAANAEVRLLGHPTPLRHRVNESGALVVDFPDKAPCEHAYALKITGFEFAPAAPRTVKASE
jgi:alpha-L-fucosidase